MFGIDDALIAAGISSAGSLIGGAMTSSGAQNMNAANAQSAYQMAQFNAAEAQKTRDWQTEMSNTAYRRAMADMKAAGLNPILAYQQGGAGTPGGATGSGSAPQFENVMEGVGHGVTSAAKGAEAAIGLQQIKSQTEKQVSEASLNKANEVLTGAKVAQTNQDTATSAAQMNKANAEAALTTEQMKSPEAQRALFGAQSHSAFQAGEKSRVEREQLEKYGPGKIMTEIVSPAERLWQRFKNATEGSAPSPFPIVRRLPRPGDDKGLVIDIDKRK